MSDDRLIGRATACKALLNSDEFQLAFQEVRDAQAAVFLNASGSSEDRERAHQIIRALHEIQQTLEGHVADGTFAEHRKGQHRGSD